MSDSAITQGLVERLAEEFLERYRRGERPNIAEYADAHPELAIEIADIFSTLTFMEEFAIQTVETLDIPLAILGDFRIVREVGRGGMGVVYEAVQESLGRHVALKVLPPHIAVNSMGMRRFHREAKAAAKLHHTSIVPIYEVGVEGDIHYYAMQFINGQALSQLLVELAQARKEGNPSSVTPFHDRKVAAIGLQAAGALAYAHSQNVLHRDIKPGNIMIEATGAVWVTDFGLAKEESDNLTQSGELVGTFRYMAPERFCGTTDARSDVYGLGLTLYEMLTLRPAFADSDRGRLMRCITDTDPPRPSTLEPLVSHDLETIVLKAIAKEPRQRYQTAQALADDLQLFLADRPILARRASHWEHVWRWCRRNRAAAAFATATATMLVAVAVVSSVFAINYNRQLASVEAAEHDTRLEIGKSLLGQGSANLRTELMGHRFESLALLRRSAEILRAEPRGAAWLPEVRDRMICAHGLTDVCVAWERRHRPSMSLAFDARLELYVSDDRETGEVVVHLSDDGRELARLPHPGPLFWHVNFGFSPDGQYLTVCYFLRERPELQLDVWKLATQTRVFSKVVTVGVFNYHPDSRRFVFCPEADKIQVWDLVANQGLQTFPLTAPPGHVAVSPDGRWLAVNASDVDLEQRPQAQQLKILDFASGAVRASWTVDVGDTALSWSGDGKRLASGSNMGQVYVRDFEAGHLAQILIGHNGRVTHCQFAPSGSLLKTDSWDGSVRLWDADNGQCLVVARGHAAEFATDGSRMGFIDGARFGVWNVAHGSECRTINPNRVSPFMAAPHQVYQFSQGDYSPDGRLLAVGSRDGLSLVDTLSARSVAHLAIGNCESVLFFADGRGLIAFSERGLYYWPIRQHADGVLGHRQIGPPHLLYSLGADEWNRAAWLPGQDTLAVWDTNRSQALLLDVSQPATGSKLIGTLPGKYHRATGLAFSPDGKWLATGGFKNPGQVWNVAAGRLEYVLKPCEGKGDTLFSVAFTRDNRSLIAVTLAEEDAGYYEFAISTWERRRFEETTELCSCAPPIQSRDGTLIALAHGPRQLRLIDPATGKPLAHIAVVSHLVPIPLAFRPDGTQLAIATNDGTIQLWDLRRLRKKLATFDLDWDQPVYPPTMHRSEFPLAITVDYGNFPRVGRK